LSRVKWNLHTNILKNHEEESKKKHSVTSDLNPDEIFFRSKLSSR